MAIDSFWLSGQKLLVYTPWFFLFFLFGVSAASSIECGLTGVLIYGLSLLFFSSMVVVLRYLICLFNAYFLRLFLSICSPPEVKVFARDLCPVNFSNIGSALNFNYLVSPVLRVVFTHRASPGASDRGSRFPGGSCSVVPAVVLLSLSALC